MSTRRRSVASRRKSESANLESDNDIDMLNSEEESDGSLGEMGASGENDDLYQMIIDLSQYLCTVKEDGEELAEGFQRIPNRRVLPDYFEVISSPVAFSTIRGKIHKKLYTSFTEFVRDVAQICHNAQVYNRPSAPIFSAAVRLQQIFKEKLEELARVGKITTAEAVLPNLGDLPPVEESPSRDSDMEDDEEDDDDDDDDYDDDSDDDGRRRGRGNRRTSLVGRHDRDGDKDDATKKRGRPPMVLTPMEARISAILRGLRKFKDDDGNLLIAPFEKLPDKAMLPDYYQTIGNPIAIDNIKKKAKRKKYRSVDQVLADINLMFDNAKTYNEDDSELYQAAVELQKHAQDLASQEKAKPDDDFRDEDGKLPLADTQHNGETWKVGDWVHIRNPNDLAKPIVAQIYRMWQDRAGERWINACWYYRPEQTVHRYEKHFFEHEVVKTGQYRDHQVGEIVDRCFVMFVTRFNKGRPRGFPHDKDVYVCESRYNEERFRFNKIKTWASCVPDEVREKDYEMDLFDAPRRMKKVPSPIKHLLREDAKETDDFPKPTWGSPNAPPIVGAVHRRPPESNESPPPEPTPPPTGTSHSGEISIDQARHSQLPMPARDSTSASPARGMAPVYGANGVAASPNRFHGQPTPSSHSSGNTHTPHTIQQTPVPLPPVPSYAHHPQAAARQMQFPHSQQPGYMQNYNATTHSAAGPPANYQHANSSFPPQTQSPQANYAARAPPQMMHAQQGQHPNAYNPPRPPEVYTLPESINDAIPQDIREDFKRDGLGRVLFFAAPPLDRRSKLDLASAHLGHSVKYLAGREAWLKDRELKRKQRDELRSNMAKRRSPSATDDDMGEEATLQARAALHKWFQQLNGDAKWSAEDARGRN